MMTPQDYEELLQLFKEEYDDYESAQDTLKGIREDLKSFASKIKVEPKAINSAWNLFKKYASGKVTSQESSDSALLESAVIEYFNGVNE